MSEFLRIGPGVPVTTTQIAVALSDASEEAVLAALRADWNRVPALTGCAIHRSLSGDTLVAHAQWSASIDAIAFTRTSAQRILDSLPGCSVDVLMLTLDSVRGGRSHDGGSFELRIQAHSSAPVLIAVFEPVLRSRDALLKYLHESSVRFAAQVDGWMGAALYCGVDDPRVVEYLQFENMQGVSTSQASPLIQAHQLELQRFGPVAANLYLVQDIYDRRVN